ncbi:hypothetical protein, partial [Sphingomonas sp. Leaf33]|uniref:hypothetical protein n=1 Tax=Sphingomonas sp. Leaf33 TaxID=1736215 RepID=UPI001F3C1820
RPHVPSSHQQFQRADKNTDVQSTLLPEGPEYLVFGDRSSAAKWLTASVEWLLCSVSDSVNRKNPPFRIFLRAPATFLLSARHWRSPAPQKNEEERGSPHAPSRIGCG